MSWLARLAERRIQAARLKGGLQGLAGEGKPLPDRPGDAFVSAGDAVGFRIMAEAGVLPEEIALKKMVAAQRAHLASLTDEVERRKAMAELARLEMRQAMAEEARRRFLRD
jgi:voltage-gated potassium channel Kch